MTGMLQDEGDLRSPDFLIVGAMKCGTTSLYTQLKNHPEVFMPPLEVGYFDIDDIQQHPDFFKVGKEEWHYHSFNRDRGRLENWYRSLFEAVDGERMIGERSTTYMASSVAPVRIRDAVPGVRLIFMLRDPVPRAYSNYWHLLRSGEATGSFERTLRYRHSVLFNRGLYRDQIERYMSLFDRNQMKFILFERFVREPGEVLEEVCEFLGIDPGGFSEEEQLEHRNPGRYPWSLALQCVINGVLFHGVLNGHRYLGTHLPALTYEALRYGPLRRASHEAVVFVLKALSRVNCSRGTKPEMKAATRRMLTDLYEDRNRGLSKLIGKDLSEWWTFTDV